MSTKPARKTTVTREYIAIGWARSITPKRRPRGTDWMPSSPPVNFAWRATKKIICASASVIIAK